MEETGERFPTRIDAGGMEVDTPYYANFVSAIMFNTKITEMESKMKNKIRRHRTSSD